jgi:proliferating cell nuclear antigen
MNIVIHNQQKSECFAAIFQHIKLMTDNINIVFDQEKMYVQSMDNSRISIFEITIPRTWFDEYTIPGNVSGITIGISSTILFRILNIRDKMQSTHLVYSTLDDSDKLFVHFLSDAKSIFDKHFEIPLMEMESEVMSVPDFEYAAELSVLAPYFANIIGQLKLFGDTLEVQCSEDKIMMSSTTTESGKMSVEIGIDDLTEFAIEEDADLHLSFSLTYLHNICMYNKLAKNIDIKLSNNYPMRVDYDIGEGASIKFYLAPKIED